MNKIESLTPAQERRLIEYRDEWLAVGRSTAPADRPKTEAAISQFYGYLGKEKPRFWWCDGPAVGSIVRTILRANLGDNLRENLGANLRANLWVNLGVNLGVNLRENLGANVRENLRANLWVNLGANVRENVRENLGANVRANLWENLGVNLRENLRENLGANLRENVDWYFWGAHESAWPAYYLFPHQELREMYNREQLHKLRLWIDICRSAGWWEPFANVVFVCERPERQIVNQSGRLHCENGPALLWRDGWPVYALNGIRVNGKWIETPAEKIDPKEVMAEPNVDVRREVMRKVGVERMLAVLQSKQLHKRGNYEVLSVQLSDQLRDARYLKMLNPSIGVWHLEGIPAECDTVEKALTWRNQNFFTDAEILT